ncbi:hypothetical protein L218DRAFT_948401 [Marasmius fiardii PR-910]|nr:hypothetical protein L218DRAFT_948401 [Marasmius fiardii PR-910]
MTGRLKVDQSKQHKKVQTDILKTRLSMEPSGRESYNFYGRTGDSRPFGFVREGKDHGSKEGRKPAVDKPPRNPKDGLGDASGVDPRNSQKKSLKTDDSNSCEGSSKGKKALKRKRSSPV